MTKPAFIHNHSAHCESGVMALMLRHHGLQLSEAMVFGLSGALMFAYIPFIKLGGLPLIAYRSRPHAIIRGLQKNIGLRMRLQTFRRARQGTAALDTLLAQGEIVGAQTSVFWLPYFPEEMRFHFNAHNLIVYGKEGNEYLVSDPVFEQPVRCLVEPLEKARFVKGMMAPKGLIYYPVAVPKTLDFGFLLPRIIRKNARAMLYSPVPIAGVSGIRRLAEAITRLEKKDPHYAKLLLGHIIRMQEEIGTGGAGFRFIYASFLQEAGKLLAEPRLEESSMMMTATGDQWREFALMLARSLRGKKNQAIDFASLRRKLESVAESETQVYRKLLATVG
ncbi:MAG TPA: DUF4872 domain-containing protein [Proteobacteria bacterium]|nr:DUF4872 domain-containing protein [Pseudomonadota bacterium]